jgi:hypothetical protein
MFSISVPDAAQLTHILSDATAPTFFLGSVAAFASLMTSRMQAALARVQFLNAIPDHDTSRATMKADVDRLLRRAKLLKSGILASLRAAFCATALLADLFLTEFFGLQHAYGAGFLFALATAFLGYALYCFAREVEVSLGETDGFG